MILNNEGNQNFLLSSIPAKWIDQLLLKSPEFGTTQSASQFGARMLSLVISVTVFPVFLIIDLAAYSVKSLALRTWTVICPTDGNYREAQKSHEIAMKCFRGMVTFPAGIVWRDVVSNHFLAEKAADGKIHPTGGLYASGADIRRPKSKEGVAQFVKEALEGGQKISISGAGYCQGKQTLPTDAKNIHLDMKRLKSVQINQSNKTATVGAGATWSKIQKKADRKDLAIQVMQASNVFSVGGSISANCHGWDHTAGTLANTINSITIVNAKGEIETLTPEDELFRYVVGGYGMFGVIVEVELQLIDNEEFLDTAEPVEIKDYYEYFKESVLKDPDKKMHLYRLGLTHGKLLQEGWAQNYCVVKDSVGETERLKDEPERGSVADRVLMQVARNSPRARSLWWKQEAARLEESQTEPKKYTRNAIMRPKMNAVFANNSVASAEWLQEYFVSGENLSEFLKFLSNVLNENDVALLNASVRYVTKDEKAALGYATEGDRFAIVLFFNQSLNEEKVDQTRKWVQQVVEKLTEINGTFYLPYMHFATQEQFKTCYPNWEEVLEKKATFDPKGVFHNGFYEEYFCENEEIELYRRFDQNSKLADFLRNVFKQVDVDSFMEMYSEAVKEKSPADIYEYLRKHTYKAKGNAFSKLRMGLNALKKEKKTLADNVAKVMDPNRPKNGYVEIGMPGRMIKTIKPLMGLKGKITVVNEHEDRIQSGLIHPYDEFHELTYEPLDLETESVDVVSCFAGLHHCPEDKLDAFIESIHGTLQEGGVFLLREHDTKDKEMLELANVIHRVFNAASDVSLEEEVKEVRNFKSLEEWKQRLEAKGFQLVSDPLIRDGDSTENALLKFVKVSKEKDLTVVREKLISQKSDYTRPIEQTYMTTMEWFNVESSQNVGKYENCWDYPYFRDVGEAWKAYGKSWKSARRVQSFSKVLFSGHNLMNTVILVMMTVEYVVKGLFYTVIWALAKLTRFLPEKEACETWEQPVKEYQKWLDEYGKSLEHTTYYAHSYLPSIKTFWKNFATSWNETRESRSFLDLTFDRQTLKNVVVGITMTVDLCVRALIATPINWFYGGEENGDDREIGLIIKTSSETALSKDIAIEEEGNPYKGLVVPRYKELEAFLKELVSKGVEIVEIAGQKEIQIDFIVDLDDESFSEEAGFLYERKYLFEAEEKKIAAVTITMEDLPKYLNNKSYSIHRIYDF